MLYADNIGVLENSESNTVGNENCYKVHCKCSRRLDCLECHEYWISRLWRSSLRWLDEVRSDNTVDIFACLTVSSEGTWLEQLERLFAGWSKLGRTRSQKIRDKTSEHALFALKRGVGAVHLNPRDGMIRPHMHAIFVADTDCDHDWAAQPLGSDMREAWKSSCSGVEYSDFELARSCAGALRYAIRPGLPAEVADRLALAKALKGRHLVRRIG